MMRHLNIIIYPIKAVRAVCLSVAVGGKGGTVDRTVISITRLSVASPSNFHQPTSPRSSSLPFPSCPWSFLPIDQSDPSVRRSRLWFSPAATEAFVSAYTREGTKEKRRMTFQKISTFLRNNIGNIIFWMKALGLCSSSSRRKNQVERVALSWSLTSPLFTLT